MKGAYTAYAHACPSPMPMFWGGLLNLVALWGIFRWRYAAIKPTIDRAMLPGIAAYILVLTVGVWVRAEVRRWRDER